MKEIIPVIIIGAISSMITLMITSYKLIFEIKEKIYEKLYKKLEWENKKLELANEMYIKENIYLKKELTKKEEK